MASTANSVFGMAKKKRADRRGLVGDNGHLADQHVATLAAAALQALGQAANNTKSTFVVGRLVHSLAPHPIHLFGFGIPVLKRPALAAALNTQVMGMNWVTTDGVPNLHGEMSIVKYCLDNLSVSKSQLDEARYRSLALGNPCAPTVAAG